MLTFLCFIKVVVDTANISLTIKKLKGNTVYSPTNEELKHCVLNGLVTSETVSGVE